MRVLRFLRIAYTAARFGLARSRPRGERLRQALESLGPVFVKFGQLLSVRPDLIPEDVASDLAKLQDEVPAVPWSEVQQVLARAYGKPHGQVFATLESVPV